MQRKDRLRQAEAFAAMYQRDSGGGWEQTFDRWVRSKGLADLEAAAIQRVVYRLLLADGTLVVTDPHGMEPVSGPLARVMAGIVRERRAVPSEAAGERKP